jgi:uncharacterized protein YbaP (TraB family)
MKKRLLSLLLILVLCITMIPNVQVLAAEQKSETIDELKSYAEGQTFSDWVLGDLLVAETYGLYPIAWHNKDMTVPITAAKLQVLLVGLRHKMFDTDVVQSATEPSYKISQKLTVEDVINQLYGIVAAYSFTSELVLKDVKALTFMKENGIYTGKNGELALKDTCSIEQACVIATRLVTVIYDKLDAASKGFLWKTEANGNTVYMFGSIHLANTQMYPLSNKVLAAFKTSEALAVEVNILSQAGAMELLNLAVYTDGTGLKDHVSKDVYDKVIALGASLGLPEAQIAMFKPWYLYISFNSLSATESGTMEAAAAEAMLGIDMNFLNNAMLSGKPILEVEGYLTQGMMLDSFSDELEEYLLAATLEAVSQNQTGADDSSAEVINTMQEMWSNGDEEGLKKYLSFEYEYQDILTDAANEAELKVLTEFNNKLFIERNKTMAAYIEGLLKAESGHTYFVVVGAGHYIGDANIIEILKKQGYEVTAIK